MKFGVRVRFWVHCFLTSMLLMDNGLNTCFIELDKIFCWNLRLEEEKKRLLIFVITLLTRPFH